MVLYPVSSLLGHWVLLIFQVLFVDFYPYEHYCVRKMEQFFFVGMRNTGLDEAQAGIKIAKRNINNLRYADDTTLMAESEEELKSLLMKVKEESEKNWLKA